MQMHRSYFHHSAFFILTSLVDYFQLSFSQADGVTYADNLRLDHAGAIQIDAVLAARIVEFADPPKLILVEDVSVLPRDRFVFVVDAVAAQNKSLAGDRYH